MSYESTSTQTQYVTLGAVPSGGPQPSTEGSGGPASSTEGEVKPETEVKGVATEAQSKPETDSSNVGTEGGAAPASGPSDDVCPPPATVIVTETVTATVVSIPPAQSVQLRLT